MKNLNLPCEYVDPFREEDPNLWVKIEHLGRYMFARDQLAAKGSKLHLDLGCATGYGLRELEGVVTQAVGMDYDQDALDIASSRLEKTKLIHIDLDEAPISSQIKENSVTSVTAFEFMEHVDNVEKLIDNLRTVMVEGGTVIASVPNILFEKEDDHGNPRNPHHDRIFKDGEFKAILEARGFSVEMELGQPLVGDLPLKEKKLTKKKIITSKPSRLPEMQKPDVVRAFAYMFAYPQCENIAKTYAYTFVAKAV
ncbi:MAG: SAM-dependent methyltransferase [bacterium]|jgi:SAM-dependent methyltransferase